MDRPAIIWRADPRWTQREEANGVVELDVSAIRANTTVTSGRKKTLKVHLMVVEPDPLRANPAHAEVVANPAVKNKALKRMKTALADIADGGWVIRPRGHR